MDAKLFGLPFLVWAGICLLVAAFWMRFWPREKAAAARGPRLFVLRWFHALTWLMLALAALATALLPASGESVARILGLLGLAAYLAFVGALATSR